MKLRNESLSHGSQPSWHGVSKTPNLYLWSSVSYIEIKKSSTPFLGISCRVWFGRSTIILQSAGSFNSLDHYAVLDLLDCRFSTRPLLTNKIDKLWRPDRPHLSLSTFLLSNALASAKLDIPPPCPHSSLTAILLHPDGQ